MNEPQKHAILFCCLDIHRRLAELESLLAQSLSPSPFSRHEDDLSPAEREAIGDSFTRVRESMLAWLEEADIPLEVPRKSARWALQCGLTALDISVAEMSPERLLDHGPFSGRGQAQARKIEQELSRLIGRAAASVQGSQCPGGFLCGRGGTAHADHTPGDPIAAGAGPRRPGGCASHDNHVTLGCEPGGGIRP